MKSNICFNRGGIALLLTVAMLLSMVGCVPQDQNGTNPTDTQPTTAPTNAPTQEPTVEPTAEPTAAPTQEPTVEPTGEPTEAPTAAPTEPTATEPTTATPTGPSDTPTTPAQPVKVNRITISGGTTVTVGKTLQLSVAVEPANAANKSVTWSIISGANCAGINANGLLTATAAGTVTVKAMAQDGSNVSATYTVTVQAAASSALWDGAGTSASPYLIKNLTDLKNLATVTGKSGYYFKQVADIDCASVAQWIVIGTNEKPFRHNYDGGGYKISNLCLDGDTQALFSVVEDSCFKNMNIVNAHTGKSSNGGYTGAIAGYGIGCSFENCTATVNFQSSNDGTGGLIGFIVLKETQKTLMVNCHVSGTITGSGHTGGLIAQIWHYGYNSDYAPDKSLPVKNCSADVTINVSTSGGGTACVGGLIGEANGVRIEKCHATGSITALSGDIGGLVGDARQNVDIMRCYADVDILATTDSQYGGVSAGGLIGHIYSRNDVYDCYATGNITAPNVRWSPCQDSTPKNGGPWRKYYNPCGSLIGTLEVFRAYSEDQKITVYNCYATGKVNAPNICEDERVYCHGALIGLVLDRYTITNVTDKTKEDQSSWDGFSENYIGHFGNNYNIEALRTYYSPVNDYARSGLYGLQNPKYTALPTHDFVAIVTQAQLKQQSTFEGWDFQNVWKMGANGPELR